MNYLGLKFPLPKPEVPVDRRELTVLTNGESRTYTLPGSALLSDELVFGEKDDYSVTLVDVDANGNRSIASEPLHGSIVDDARPPKPAVLGPIVPANKRFLTEEEAVQAKADAAKRFAEQTKAEQLKAEQLAKAEADRKAAHDKIDADAKAALQKATATHSKPHAPK